ncbi:MAG: fibronectin type III domain-containing protein [Planctomycetes bacterium]|nr:fibronectin type III domain-containing protein [Planctomycetota bacterium]MCB9890496.1 fibronectin type III domain-containing protein [Planctomycetota bacterium]MCB9917737.1 fibronectin type III domain-containing protein [Planctomycetota bacterium]
MHIEVPYTVAASLVLITVPIFAQVGLRADRTDVATTRGANQQLFLDAGPRHVRAPYLILGSSSATRQGLGLGSVHVPLDVDEYTTALLAAPNRWLVGSVGLLDEQGRARARFELLELHTSLLGMCLQHAALVFSAHGMPIAGSNAVPLRVAAASPTATQQLDYATLAGGGMAAIDELGFVYTVMDVKTSANSTPHGRVVKIDPTKQGDASIVWQTDFGVGQTSVLHGMTYGRDATGNPHVYVCGWTFAQDFGLDSFDTVHGGGRDGFVLMFDADGGQRQAGAYLSQTVTGEDRSPQTMTVRGGSLYLVGRGGQAGLWYVDAFDTEGGGAWVMRMAGDLSTLDWSTQLPGDGISTTIEQAYDVEVDANDDVYVAGFTESVNPADLSVYASGYDGSFNGKRDGYVLKLGQVADGQGGTRPVPLVYTYLGGTSGLDAVYDIQVVGGKVYVAGRTESNDFPVTNASTLNGRSDVVLARLDAGLSQLEFCSYFGGKKDEGLGIHSSDLRARTIGIAVGFGRIHLTGTTQSNDLPTTPGAIDASHDSAPSKQDVFVARFANAATTPSLTELTYLGGSGDDAPQTSPWLDANGSLYLAYETTATNIDDLTSSVSILGTGVANKISYDDPPQNPPAAPIGLAASAFSCQAIDLSWTDSDALEEGFTIERSAAGANLWTQIAQVAVDVTVYRDDGLTPQTAFDYRVRAFNAFGNSGWSNVASSSTLGSIPIGLHVADDETAFDGFVTGSFATTQVSDDGYESIQEVESNGNPKMRRSFLEHRWSIPLPCGASTLTFFVEAHRTNSSDGDAFAFEYWDDSSQSWQALVTVVKTSDDDQAQSAALPSGLSGSLLLRVVDTDRTPGNNAVDTVFVDRLWVQSS